MLHDARDLFVTVANALQFMPPSATALLVLLLAAGLALVLHEILARLARRILSREGSYLQAFLRQARFGMPLFFTLSGFIIHYVYADAFAAQRRRAVGEFAIARFSRIYPLYAVLLAYQLFRTPMGPPLAHLSELPILLAYLTASWTWFPYQIGGDMHERRLA